jgi:PAS domain S-box-containing protein
MKISSLTILLGAFLSLTIAIASGVSVKILHDKALEDWSLQAKSMALILSENTEQQMTAAWLALDGIVERIRFKTVAGDGALRAQFSDEATFQMLSDKAGSTPQIDVATIVAANGEVINFSRKWPAPKINLADRDYFQVLRDDPKKEFYLGKPVRNKGNGKWTFYLSRRLNSPGGAFLGVVLVGISTDYYSDFYARINLDGKASITLLRDDFTIMARWPNNEKILGDINLTGSTYHIVHNLKKREGVLVTNSPRKAANGETGHPRMGAVRLVKKYPLIINYTIEEDLYLGAWRQTTRVILLVALGSILAVVFTCSALVRALKRREQAQAETLRLKQQAEQSANEKSRLLENLSQNQQALRDSSEHMSAIVDNAPDAVLIIDDQGTILSCNRAAEAIFACSAVQMQGSRIDSWLPGHDVLAAGLSVAVVEGLARRSHGAAFPCDLSQARFQLSGQGRQVLLVRDITERKNMERARNEFVSMVSHELRTPLTAIRGSLGLLKGGVAGVLPKMGSDMVLMAYDNTERLSRMINDLLDLQKMEAGKMVFEFTLQALFPLLQSAVVSNQPYAGQCSVTIALDGEIPDAMLRVDEGRFQQVMSNLLSNACKFSPQGSVVQVRASLAGQQVKIEIVDRGPGIAAEFKSRMFQRFAQADSSDTRQKGGTGLGLSITRDIVQLMQGEIDYQSEAGQGTTFFVTFPLAAAGE